MWCCQFPKAPVRWNPRLERRTRLSLLSLSRPETSPHFTLPRFPYPDIYSPCWSSRLLLSFLHLLTSTPRSCFIHSFHKRTQPTCFLVEHIHSLHLTHIQKMKAFIAVPALFAAAAVASPSWSFTFTFSDAHSTWTSCTYATAAPNATTAVPTSSAWTGPSEWTSTTSYNATFSSGSSTWAVPETVSYSLGETWTSMIAATVTPPSSTVSVEATTAAPATTTPASTTAAAPASTFTGAANVNGKMAGGAALAFAGLALVL